MCLAFPFLTSFTKLLNNKHVGKEETKVLTKTCNVSNVDFSIMDFIAKTLVPYLPVPTWCRCCILSFLVAGHYDDLILKIFFIKLGK